MSAPHWCDPCAGYRPRGHDCARRRSAVPGGQETDWAQAQAAAARVAAVTSDDYRQGWAEGYYSALRDQAERQAAA